MMVVSIVVYAVSYVLIRTLSRYREFAADRGAAIITGAPEQLMSALQKISSQMTLIPQQDLREVEGMNAFFIIPAKAKSATAELFASHPPLEKRLAALAEIARADGPPGRPEQAGATPGGPPRSSSSGATSSPSRATTGCSRSRPRWSRWTSSSACSPPGSARVTFKPLSSGDFDRADTDIEELLRAAARVGRLDRSSARPTPTATSG